MAIDELPVGVVLDGELVAMGRDGLTGQPTQDFASAVSVAVRTPGHELACRLRVYAFDLLKLDGSDLCSRPQAERSRLLAEFLDGPGGSPIDRTMRMPVQRALIDAITDAGWEGVVLKRENAPYRPGERSSAWRKLKARHQARARLLALLPARREDQPDRVLVEDEFGRWPAILWPGPMHRELVELGGAAIGRQINIAYSRRDADQAPRKARVSLLLPVSTVD